MGKKSSAQGPRPGMGHWNLGDLTKVHTYTTRQDNDLYVHVCMYVCRACVNDWEINSMAQINVVFHAVWRVMLITA